MGTGAHAPRPESAVLQHARHALLSDSGLRPFLQAGISAPLPGAAGENARAQARLRDRFFFQAEDGIRDDLVTGVQTCALPISTKWWLPQPWSEPSPLEVSVR